MFHRIVDKRKAQVVCEGDAWPCICPSDQIHADSEHCRITLPIAEAGLLARRGIRKFMAVARAMRLHAVYEYDGGILQWHGRLIVTGRWGDAKPYLRYLRDEGVLSA